ncbi:MAG: hypothetical protein HC887_05105 [Desulfobacteraceae bacterium]|nr:hypothetical protein [Desulfobacteraceae bacterium]
MIWQNFQTSDTISASETARIVSGRKDAALSETESFDIKGLDQYLLNQKLLEKSLSGADLSNFFKIKLAAGELPHGTVGECAYRNFSSKIRLFSEKLMPYLQDSRQESSDIDTQIGDFRIIGRIEGIRSQRLIRFRYAVVTPKDRLSAWIHHLLLNMTQGMSTILIGSDKIIEYPAVREPYIILENLLLRYWQGLRKPLHFFPKSSFEYAHALINGKSLAEASEKASFIWSGDGHRIGEKDDSYYRVCFRDENLPDRFGEIAKEIFEPMLLSSK